MSDTEKRQNRLYDAVDAYVRAFGVPSPEPFGIDDDALADELEKAVAGGQPIGPDFDWWARLPPDADA